MEDALGRAALAELRKVEAGTEVIALAGDDDDTRRLGQGRESVVQRGDEGVVEGVALGWPGEADLGHRSFMEDAQRSRGGGIVGGGHCFIV